MAAITSAVVGAAAIGAQAYGAHKAGKAANKAGKRQAATDQERIALGREQLDWAKGIYEHWRTEFDPMLQELKSEAMRDQTPDYAAISADTASSFGAAEDNYRIALERRGVDASDGAFGQVKSNFGIGRASAEVNARQDARRQVKNVRFQRLAATYGIGAGLQSSAMGNVNSGFGMTQNAMAGASANYGNNAANHSDNAAAGWAGAWRGLNNMLDTALAPAPAETTQPTPSG